MAKKVIKFEDKEPSKGVHRISVNDMDKIMDSLPNNEVVVPWGDTELHIKQTLSLTEMLSFVNDVVNNCFREADGSYMPEIYDFAMRQNIMERYANFAMPENLQRRYDVVMRSGAVEIIVSNINDVQFREMQRAIDEKIANKAAANVEATHVKLTELISRFENLSNNLENVFSGVSREDMQNIAAAFSDAKFSEEGLVKAFQSQKKEAE